MSEHKEINPFYLLSEWEVEPLIEIWKNHAGVKSTDIAFLKLPLLFNDKIKPDTACKQLVADKSTAAQEGRSKTIYAVTIPTRNSESYHVNEDGSMDAVQERSPQVRSYFDGSKIPAYAHSIAIGIDHSNKRVLVKDPKGHDLDDNTKRIFLDVYPDYSMTIDRRCQQFDNNNCYLHTLHNMFVMAGIEEFQGNLDIKFWNKEIIDTLETYGITQPPNVEGDLSKQYKEYYGVSDPIFSHRFL